MSTLNPSRTSVMRAASGDLTAAETSTPIINLEEYNYAAVLLNITKVTAIAGEDVDFFLQTTYDGGTTWTDIENIQVDEAENGTTLSKVLVVTPNRPTAKDVAENSTDGTLTNNTKLDLPLGSRLRFKVTINNTPTYAYNATAYLIS